MVLSYANISINLTEVSLKEKPEARVPVLHFSDGKIIDNSRDIMLWALDQNDPDNWYSFLGKQKRLKVDNLVSHNDDNFKPLLDRYQYADRYPAYSQTEYRTAAERFLKQLQRLLGQHQCLFGETVSLADIAIFPFIQQFILVDEQWFEQSSYNNIQLWYRALLETDLYQQVIGNTSPKNPDQEHQSCQGLGKLLQALNHSNQTNEPK